MANSHSSVDDVFDPANDDEDPDSIPTLDGGWIKSKLGERSRANQQAEAIPSSPKLPKNDPLPARETRPPDRSDTLESHVARSVDYTPAESLVDDAVTEKADSPKDRGAAIKPDSDADTEQKIEQDLRALSGTPIVADGAVDEVPDELLESVIREVVGKLKSKYEEDRLRYQEKIQEAFRLRLTQIEKRANQQLKRKLHSARKKDRTALKEKEAQMSTLLEKLDRLMKEVSGRRAQLVRTSKAFEQKLIESDLIQNEIHELGRNLSADASALVRTLFDESEEDPKSVALSPPPVPRMNPRGQDPEDVGS